MSFAVSLKAVAEDIDRLLGEVLRLDVAAAPRVVEAMRYAALAQGKRLRPFFLVESATLLGAERRHALRAAAALECVHCYSLVHDDLPAMDDDDLRRGRPTCHKAFDEGTAVLVGDALQALAFQLLAGLPGHRLPAPAARLQQIQILADGIGTAGMAGGQAIDLEAVGRQLDANALEGMHRRKTGALIRA